MDFSYEDYIADGDSSLTLFASYHITCDNDVYGSIWVGSRTPESDYCAKLDMETGEVEYNLRGINPPQTTPFEYEEIIDDLTHRRLTSEQGVMEFLYTLHRYCK